jgi:hypothetical protein
VPPGLWVIVVDTRAVNFAPVLRPVAQLVFNGEPQNVERTDALPDVSRTSRDGQEAVHH